MNHSFEKARRNNSLNSDGLWDIVCYIVGCVAGEVVYQNHGMSLLGCIEANFVIKCFFFSMLSRFTILTRLCTASNLSCVVCIVISCAQSDIVI